MVEFVIVLFLAKLALCLDVGVGEAVGGLVALSVVVDPVLQALEVDVLDGANALAEGEEGVLVGFGGVKADSAGFFGHFGHVLIFK